VNPRAIKAELVRRGIRQTDIGRRLGVTHSAVNQAITGLTRSRRIREEIARLLALPVSDLWPDDAQTDVSTARRRAATTTPRHGGGP